MTNLLNKILTTLISQSHFRLSILPFQKEQDTLNKVIYLEHKNLVLLLKTIKDFCRKESISFVFYNKNHHQKTLSIVSPNIDEVAQLHIELLASERLVRSKTQLPTKKNACFLWNKIRSVKIFKNNFICLIGPDGVGKSTIASVIQQDTPSKPLRYKSVFRRSLTYKVLYSLQQRKYTSKNNYDDLHPNAVLISSLLRLYIKSILSFFSTKKILCDRYTNDHLASHLRAEAPPKSSQKISIKSRFIPAPKTIIQLDAPADVILSRRNELSEQTINFLSHFYLESSVLIRPNKIIYFNTDIPFEDTQKLTIKLLSV
jgi:thymidylate kinase